MCCLQQLYLVVAWVGASPSVRAPSLVTSLVVAFSIKPSPGNARGTGPCLAFPEETSPSFLWLSGASWLHVTLRNPQPAGDFGWLKGTKGYGNLQWHPSHFRELPAMEPGQGEATLALAFPSSSFKMSLLKRHSLTVTSMCSVPAEMLTERPKSSSRLCFNSERGVTRNGRRLLKRIWEAN